MGWVRVQSRQSDVMPVMVAYRSVWVGQRRALPFSLLIPLPLYLSLSLSSSLPFLRLIAHLHAQFSHLADRSVNLSFLFLCVHVLRVNVSNPPRKGRKPINDMLTRQTITPYLCPSPLPRINVILAISLTKQRFTRCFYKICHDDRLPKQTAFYYILCIVEPRNRLG